MKKKLLSLFVALSSLAFISCGDDYLSAPEVHRAEIEDYVACRTAFAKRSKDMLSAAYRDVESNPMLLMAMSINVGFGGGYGSVAENPEQIMSRYVKSEFDKQWNEIVNARSGEAAPRYRNALVKIAANPNSYPNVGKYAQHYLKLYDETPLKFSSFEYQLNLDDPDEVDRWDFHETRSRIKYTFTYNTVYEEWSCGPYTNSFNSYVGYKL